MSNQSSNSRTQVQHSNVLRLRPTQDTPPHDSHQQHQQQPQSSSSSSATHNQTEPSSATREKRRQKQRKPGVRWTEDVVDNEHMNKKKTKICCIFHPQRSFDEEMADDHDHDHGGPCSSSSDSSSDSSEDESGEDVSRRNGGNKVGKPNSYEYQPHYENKSKLPN
ncbi:uncharacterized protein LODBEIA_P12870 [Lodderomyces beijingensis]|uniref:Type 1 phosphatases regulator n=1 Tax=Lodderomyces beijingensis TaxID=1775926 RepID=A0ABP0ZFX9_9ASCO